MKRRYLIRGGLGVASSLLLIGCTRYEPYFDIEWDEEVLLHDGRIIWVHIKRTFQRRSEYDQWDGIHRDTEISFDTGGKIGRFTKKFERYDVNFLHFKEGTWYLSLFVTTGTPPVQLVDYAKPFLVFNPDGVVKNISWKELPSEFLTRNLMPLSPDSAGVAKFSGTKLRQSDKLMHWKNYPRAAGDTPTLVRP